MIGFGLPDPDRYITDTVNTQFILENNLQTKIYPFVRF